MIKCFVNKRNCPGFFQGECLSIENCQFQWEDDEEMSRRKTKTERELVADINKRFDLHCSNTECRDCDYLQYRGVGMCKMAYLAALLGEELEVDSWGKREITWGVADE